MFGAAKSLGLGGSSGLKIQNGSDRGKTATSKGVLLGPGRAGLRGSLGSYWEERDGLEKARGRTTEV